MVSLASKRQAPQSHAGLPGIKPLHSPAINKNEVQRIILDAQHLGPKTRMGAAKLIDQLGYVQIDTLAVVQRSHHLTMWTRLPRYQPRVLHDLQANKRKIFEYWTHAMSYVPMADYRYYLPRMRNFNRSTDKWVLARLEQCKTLLKPVLRRIRKEGPLGAKDFEKPKGKAGSWWDWKPAKMALEFLMWRGDLMVAHRENFHKRYDLTERVLPEGTDTGFPSPEEVGRFIVRRAIKSMGVASEKDLCAYLQPGSSRDSDFHAVDRKDLLRALEHLIEAKEIVRLQIEPDPKTTHYASKARLARAVSKREEKQLFLLSPFDNLIIQRKRTRRIFDFDYALECYLPAAKRKHGYFVMPILWGSQMVGRLDPKADRKSQTLQIQNLVMEPGFNELDEFLPALAEKLHDFAKFNVCERVNIGKTQPKKLGPIIKRQLNSSQE
jgi:uncharacterized protein YcaQ